MSFLPTGAPVGEGKARDLLALDRNRDQAHPAASFDLVVVDVPTPLDTPDAYKTVKSVDELLIVHAEQGSCCAGRRPLRTVSAG